MFNSYNDKCLYELNVGTDSFNNIKYSSGVIKDFRFIKAKQTLDISSKGTQTVFNRIYHSSFEVYEGDRIGGKLVKAVAPIRGITGILHYWKVWVE